MSVKFKNMTSMSIDKELDAVVSLRIIVEVLGVKEE
jgi:hypothetical protein